MSEHETAQRTEQPGEFRDHVFCPTNAVLTLLSGRWTLHIVRALLDGKARFNDIARAQGINPRTLRERLRELEAEGVVTRTVVSEIPPHVEYALTEKGKALNGIFEALAQWGIAWMRPKGAELVDEPAAIEVCEPLPVE
jgi:DNA-binding HxlR family transcriptional regulator